MDYDSYYPRPLLKRDSFYSLNGEWDVNGHKVIVPYPLEAKINSYPNAEDVYVYTKSFVLPDGFYSNDKRVILHFGAVDQKCKVYINDVFVKENTGGYLPFEADITEQLKTENIIRVEVIDTLDHFYPYGKQTNTPKGMWYTPVSGIWQSVWMEAVGASYIRNIEIKTDMNNVYLHIDSDESEFTVTCNDKTETYSSKDIIINIKNPHLWSLDDPYLYDLTITTSKDTVSSYFGLREVKMIDDRLYLNNKPVFLNGLLDQGYFKDYIYTPKSIEDYKKDIKNMKELGFNLLRKHIKVEPEMFYTYCDQMGMLVMQDMVNQGDYSFFFDTALPTAGFLRLPKPTVDKKRFDFFINHSKRTIRKVKSHPSLIAYTIYNEGWGQQSASKAYEILKKEDPDRFFDSTSGWFFDNKSDFDSYHVYFKTKVLKYKRRPLILSECGGFTRDVRDDENTKIYGYGKTDSEEALTDKIIEMHDLMSIPSIKNGMMGIIYTQVSDVENEINGIYSFDRKICKVNKERIREVNRKLQEEFEKNI